MVLEPSSCFSMIPKPVQQRVGSLDMALAVWLEVFGVRGVCERMWWGGGVHEGFCLVPRVG